MQEVAQERSVPLGVAKPMGVDPPPSTLAGSSERQCAQVVGGAPPTRQLRTDVSLEAQTRHVTAQAHLEAAVLYLMECWT